MKRLLTICGLMVSVALSAQQPTYSLEQLLDSALVNNISVKSARYDLQAAAQQHKEAFTKYFPQVSAAGLWFNANKNLVDFDINPGEFITPQVGAALSQILPAEVLAAIGNPINITAVKNGTIAGITAVQPIFAGGQIVNGNKLAKVGEEVKSLMVEISENDVEKTVSAYYWHIVSLQEKLNTIAAAKALVDDICKNVTVAVEAGVAMRNDLLQVQLRQNELDSQKLKAENGLALLKLLTAQYCGLADDNFSIDGAVTDDAAIIPKQDHTQALFRTPEFALLGKQVEAAGLMHKMELGKLLPTVGVGAGYNYTNILDKNQRFGMIFATVSIPISDWWGGSHALKRKKIEYQKAVETRDYNAAMLRIGMQSAWNDVEESWEQLLIARRSIEQAQENLRLNMDYYEAGISKMSELLEAQLLYQQTLDKKTDAYAAYRNKVVAYRIATAQ